MDRFVLGRISVGKGSVILQEKREISSQEAVLSAASSCASDEYCVVALHCVILCGMQIPVSSYIARNSAVHHLDARVKIVLLLEFTISLFLVNTWWGIGLFTVALYFTITATKIGPRPFHAVIIPVEILAIFTLIFNAFSFDAAGYAEVASHSFSGLNTAMLSGVPAISCIGPLSLVPEGVERGAFLAWRIILLVQASLVLSYTTTSTQLMAAFSFFLKPLRALRVPVDDMVTVFSLALRFIPVTAEEFGKVHDAQLARGASFNEGSLWTRLKAWQTVLIPLFVGLFRRADVLASAMEARCYGEKEKPRTELQKICFGGPDAVVLGMGLVFCLAISFLF